MIKYVRERKGIKPALFFCDAKKYLFSSFTFQKVKQGGKKMAKRLKRAFTIVELVIVIAVIAILAAVLIPTFTTLIDKANESNDIALVKNLNTALVSKEATDEVNTMQDALDAAYEYGYTVDKLTPSSSGDIVWDEVNNRFALINEKSYLRTAQNLSREMQRRLGRSSPN